MHCVANSRRTPPPRIRGTGTSSPVRLPPARLAPREELAAAARVAPLLRTARDLAAWAGDGRLLGAQDGLTPGDADAARAALDVSHEELLAAWDVAMATGMLVLSGHRTAQGGGLGALDSGQDGEVLGLWADALRSVLGAENMDGLATALYTAGGPVRIDALFEAYAAAAGAAADADEAGALPGPDHPAPRAADLHLPADVHLPGGWAADADVAAAAVAEADAAAACALREAGIGPVAEAERGLADIDPSGLSVALETFADLGVVELGADEETAGLTVSLSPLGVWGMQDRLRARGWRVPVLGGSAAGGAVAVLAALADYDAEDGEQEIAAWLGRRSPRQAAAELVNAAGKGSPGLRGAAFAVLDRVGEAAVPAVRRALDNPVLRPHAAVWLREHGEQAEMTRRDSAWLLVDLGAGLLEEADPGDVVADLLPDLPPRAQGDLVAGLWEVDHPAVVALLTTLSDHHPDPDVAKAARKAAFKARSRT